MLNVPEVERRLDSGSSLYDNVHTIKFTDRNCPEKKKNCVVGFGERAGGMNFVKLQLGSRKVIAVAEDNGDRLSVYHARHAHADRNSIRKMA